MNLEPIRQYLKKQEKLKSFFDINPSPNLSLIVVIPAYKEIELLDTLRSLLDARAIDQSVEVIILINGRKSDSQEIRNLNDECFKKTLKFCTAHTSSKLRFLCHKMVDLEGKRSGVGFARKWLMDEAVCRFEKLGKDGVIVNLDADCYVEDNYFEAIIQYFDKESNQQAASIHFEHRLDGLNGNQAIIDYELHLRYYIGMQRLMGWPFAFQTIGSAMAVRALAYARVGGMNIRKAGEDFYFLHKFIKNNTCGNLTSTTVFPSGRKSDRVPFGTGKAVGDISEGIPFLTYHPTSFGIIRTFVFNVEIQYKSGKSEFVYDVNKALQAFLTQINFPRKYQEILQNTSDFESFRKRFYQFFDAFQLMKALHFLRDNGYPNVPIKLGLEYYYAKARILGHFNDRRKALTLLRKYDKNALV